MPSTSNHTPKHTKALPLRLSHLADFRYPGEEVLFRTQIALTEMVPSFSLHVTLPQGLQFIRCRSPEALSPRKESDKESTKIIWDITPTSVPARLEFHVIARLVSLPQDQNAEGVFRESFAKLFRQSDEEKPFDEASVSLTPIVVSHMADYYRRYSGERLVYHTQIKVLKTVPSLTLEVELPPEVQLKSHQLSNNLNKTIPWLTSDKNIMTVNWKMERCQASSCFDYEVEGEVARLNKEKLFKSQAKVMVEDNEKPSVSAWVTVKALTKSDYLAYLPGIYQEDKLMGRFLMLFESFWKPIDAQIDNIPFYFDPQMTPPALLSWLGSVLNLDFNPHWPEERKRNLLSNAAKLYRQRGTKLGLQKYLRISTGGEVEIIEYQGKNMILGSAATLGGGIALGHNNKPFTFRVILRPAEKIPEDKQKDYRRRIDGIIAAQCPAYTDYELEIEF